MLDASPWISRFIGGINPGGRTLDVACGAGRHIVLARRCGLTVTGIDRDIAAARTAFAGDPGVMLVASDLEDGSPFPVAAGSFEGVVVTNYLWRPILPDIVAAVAPGGVLIYETFRLGNERFGRPSNPNFLLRPGELLAAVAPALHVVAYEEATLSTRRCVARICAVAPGHRWIDLPPTLGERDGRA